MSNNKHKIELTEEQYNAACFCVNFTDVFLNGFIDYWERMDLSSKNFPLEDIACMVDILKDNQFYNNDFSENYIEIINYIYEKAEDNIKNEKDVVIIRSNKDKYHINFLIKLAKAVIDTASYGDQNLIKKFNKYNSVIDNPKYEFDYYGPDNFKKYISVQNKIINLFKDKVCDFEYKEKAEKTKNTKTMVGKNVLFDDDIKTIYKMVTTFSLLIKEVINEYNVDIIEHYRMIGRILDDKILNILGKEVCEEILKGCINSVKEIKG